MTHGDNRFYREKPGGWPNDPLDEDTEHLVDMRRRYSLGVPGRVAACFGVLLLCYVIGALIENGPPGFSAGAVAGVVMCALWDELS